MYRSQLFANDYQNQDQFSPVWKYITVAPPQFKGAASFFMGLLRYFCRSDGVSAFCPAQRVKRVLKNQNRLNAAQLKAI
jgi:hypothetical protein